MAKETREPAAVTSASGGKDYSKYFDFSDAKVVRDVDGKTTYRIKGREITVNSAPNYKEEKRRGKEEIEVHYDFSIPEELRTMGVGKRYLIQTYGCQLLKKA